MFAPGMISHAAARLDRARLATPQLPWQNQSKNSKPPGPLQSSHPSLNFQGATDNNCTTHHHTAHKHRKFLGAVDTRHTSRARSAGVPSPRSPIQQAAGSVRPCGCKARAERNEASWERLAPRWQPEAAPECPKFGRLGLTELGVGRKAMPPGPLLLTTSSFGSAASNAAGGTDVRAHMGPTPANLWATPPRWTSERNLPTPPWRCPNTLVSTI